MFKGSKAQVETVFQGNEPMYYIIRFEKGGWALISAEDTVGVVHIQNVRNISYCHFFRGQQSGTKDL